MALDEALLEDSAHIGKPVLRFYGWTEPAATFGYFQKFAEVEHVTLLRPLMRRPTGGGIVPHNADWTYSLVFPPGHEWHSLKAEESYRRVHEWIRSAFAKLNVITELAPCSKKSLETVCRSRREEAHSDRKILSLVTSTPTKSGFFTTGQNRLEMRRLFLAGDNADFDFLEARVFEPAMQIAFGKTQPAVTVKLMRLVERMLEQIENHDLPAFFENFMRTGNSLRRVSGVMQCLA